LKINPSVHSSSFAETERSSKYPGEPYRPPYLEKVVEDLNKDLKGQIPDSVPKEVNHLLCMFEKGT
jgi:hypothetical protein